MSGNYYSKDDILTSQERLPCKFDMEILNLGYLDPGADSEDLAEGTKMELPYWMARALTTRKQSTISIDLPKHFREGFREVLSADANVVDLHKISPHFYNFGTLLLQFEHPDSADISKSLLNTFQARARQIMDSSQNALQLDTTQLIQKLDDTERAIFSKGQTGLNSFHKWETRAIEKLSTSDMVVNHKKRKRIAMEQQ